MAGSGTLLAAWTLLENPSLLLGCHQVVKTCKTKKPYFPFTLSVSGLEPHIGFAISRPKYKSVGLQMKRLLKIGKHIFDEKLNFKLYNLHHNQTKLAKKCNKRSLNVKGILTIRT